MNSLKCQVPSLTRTNWQTINSTRQLGLRLMEVSKTQCLYNRKWSTTSISDMCFSHIRRLAAECNSPMPVIDTAHQHLLTARAIHTNQKQEGLAIFDTLDISGIIAGSRVAAGLNGFDNEKVQRIKSSLAKSGRTEMFCSTSPLSGKTDRESACFPPILHEARILVVALVLAQHVQKLRLVHPSHLCLYVPFLTESSHPCLAGSLVCAQSDRRCLG